MTVELTKVSVNRTMPGQWAITINLKLKDGAIELFSQDFSEDYKTGDNVANIGSKFQEKMQEAITKYKSEQAIFNAPAFNTAINNLQSSLTV